MRQKRRMEQIARLRALGLFDARVPRYTSYPTAPVFSPAVGAAFQAEALAGLDPTQPVSLYFHIPFCERLCWFCACHTQGTKTLHPVEAYLEVLEAEIEQVAALLPAGIRMGRLHWGGGTPTILPPEMIHRLARAIKSAIPHTPDWEFSVEIDPTMVDRAKIEALRDEGLNRASIGIQDFAPEVQAAIGRIQPFDITAACVADLRAAGIRSLNADLVYGLPHQSEERIRRTVEQVLALDPDRLALYGYAHVPWVSKRQKLIPEEALPPRGGALQPRPGRGRDVPGRRLRGHRHRPLRQARGRPRGGGAERTAPAQLPGLHGRHLPDADRPGGVLHLALPDGLRPERPRHRRLRGPHPVRRPGRGQGPRLHPGGPPSGPGHRDADVRLPSRHDRAAGHLRRGGHGPGPRRRRRAPALRRLRRLGRRRRPAHPAAGPPAHPHHRQPTRRLRPRRGQIQPCVLDNHCPFPGAPLGSRGSRGPCRDERQGCAAPSAGRGGVPPPRPFSFPITELSRNRMRFGA
ncbi:Coproporphyrinogen III oxidase, oxygen-independent [Rubellimicrobium mesophilum DSM 19309]|uniref:Coproporphyrinogen III oxidase, oxygen-independent n=1 Tax=Rubellimicrobium mesophilum DSM 19309 TaxID=442562 RepID=A0A017HEZ1_9RHOB|nr:Coproporphyrinogen III oxidase, oxygen-independent [Rubellimicrobium mesophilum DSM 19309]